MLRDALLHRHVIMLQLARDVRPWSLGLPKQKWNEELLRIAERTPSELPRGMIVDQDEHTYTIYDGYPKGATPLTSAVSLSCAPCVAR